MTTATAVATAPEPFVWFTDPGFRRDPYPYYARMRREMPIFRTKQGRRGDSFYVTRYDDVMVLLRDTERWANDRTNAGHKASWLADKMSMGVTTAMVMRSSTTTARRSGECRSPARATSIPPCPSASGAMATTSIPGTRVPSSMS